MVIAAAVPAALLQYESHGEPGSSRCALSTLPSRWLVASSLGSQGRLRLLEHPAASPAVRKTPPVSPCRARTTGETGRGAVGGKAL